MFKEYFERMVDAQQALEDQFDLFVLNVESRYKEVHIDSLGMHRLLERYPELSDKLEARIMYGEEDNVLQCHKQGFMESGWFVFHVVRIDRETGEVHGF